MALDVAIYRALEMGLRSKTILCDINRPIETAQH